MGVIPFVRRRFRMLRLYHGQTPHLVFNKEYHPGQI